MVHADAGASRVSIDSVLEGALTTVLVKAQRALAEPAVRPATINFEWSGGGIPIPVAVDPITLASGPTTLDPILVEVPFPCRIVWAHMYAGDAAGNPIAVTASADVRLTQLLTFGGSVPLSGTGTPPGLQADSIADADLTGWQLNLTTTDTLIARLTTFTGTATWVALVLQLRPTDVPIGVETMLDASDVTYTDADGNPYVFRS